MKAMKMFTAAAAAAAIMGSAVAVVPAAQASDLPADTNTYTEQLQARASTSTPIQLQYGGGGLSYLTTSESGTSVYATFEPSYDTLVYVKFTLQRNMPASGWVDLQTKNGGKATYAWGVPKQNANVEFTNIAKYDLSHRVKIQVFSTSNYTGLSETHYSYGWLR